MHGHYGRLLVLVSACSARHRRWCSPAHEALVTEYQDARRAWEDARDSGREAHQAAGAAHSLVAMHQLEDDEYRELYPPPTFRAWLIGQRARDPEA